MLDAARSKLVLAPIPIGINASGEDIAFKASPGFERASPARSLTPARYSVAAPNPDVAV